MPLLLLGKTGVLNVKTKAFVSLNSPVRFTLNVFTAVTPWDLVPSRISSSPQFPNSGQRITPFEEFSEVWGYIRTFKSWKKSVHERDFSMGFSEYLNEQLIRPE